MAKLTLAQLEAAAVVAAAALAADPDNADLQKAKTEADAAVDAARANAKGVEVRVLVDHLGYRVDQVVTLSKAEAEQAEAAGWADSHPKAVAFAKKQGG